MGSLDETPTNRDRTPDDMDDWPRALPGSVKSACDELVVTYREADAKAIKSLNRHRIAVRLSAIFGTAAVSVAIIELARHAEGLEGKAWLLLEGIAALAVGAVVIWGSLSALMSTWLLERHKAERCRFRKYRFLLDLALASDPIWITELSAELKKDAVDFRTLDDADMERWMDDDPVADPQPIPNDDEHTVRERLRDLASHYVRQRLEGQEKYFFRQSKRNTDRDNRYKNIPLIFFFLSILFALVHFLLPAALEMFSIKTELHTEWMVAAAAILPVLGSGIRLWRSAFEFSRNTIRFRAKANTLKTLISSVNNQLRSDHRIVPEELVRDIWNGELVLEEEHREWLRLMREAEWIG